MTKEELKQKAEKHADSYATPDLEDSFRVYIYEANKDGYIAGAESREKQIQIDAEQIRALQKNKGELTDRVKELEAQIEEMKCCGNCAKYNSGYGENPCKMGASMICGEWETSIGKF